MYNLRSQIVHGEEPNWKVSEYGSIWTRITFSGYLFKRLFKIFLKESNLMEDSIFDNILEAYDMDQKLEELITECEVIFISKLSKSLILKNSIVSFAAALGG